MYLWLVIFALVTLPSDAQQSCGIPGPPLLRWFRTRVSAGRPAEPGSWPWAALIGTVHGNGAHRWRCGGVLITSRHVLTAAHCLSTVNARLLRVRLGETDVSTGTDGEHRELRARRYATHPQFTRRYYDIALITLDEAVVLGRRVRPACLPTRLSLARGLEASRRGIATGWGRSAALDEDGSIRLREVAVSVVKISACENIYQRSFRQMKISFPNGFNTKMLCAGDIRALRQPDDALRAKFEVRCKGGFGGPLVARDSRTGRYTVIGVASAGTGCQTRQVPAVYTKVSAYLDWINQETKRS